MPAEVRSIVFLLLNLFLISCAPSSSADISSLKPTIYFKPLIQLEKSTCSSAEKRDILSPSGKRFVSLCEKDYDECVLQGSCWVDDGKKQVAYNYHSKKNGQHRFIKVDLDRCPFGYGVRSICLDPYFSVAADLNYYKPGDVIFVPRLVGVELPTGETHDGFLIIRDSGGGVEGSRRFDFFTGSLSHKQKSNPFARLGFADPAKSFEFRLATAEEASEVHKSRNFPFVKASKN